MDETRQDDEAARLAGSGSRAPRPAAEVPVDFVPLRLVLRPSGVVVELTCPDMLLGRHSEADIRLPLPDVSRRHCRFVFGEGYWHIRDLKSLNGTFVNEQPIHDATICHGDMVRIGGFTFDVDLSGGPRGDEVLRAADGVLLSISRALPRRDDPPGQRQAS